MKPIYDPCDYRLIRADIKASLDRYATDRRTTGHFLRACLQNDLQQAVGRADAQNQGTLPAIVAYIYNELPDACWGSKEKVERWLSDDQDQPEHPEPSRPQVLMGEKKSSRMDRRD